jgi:hypothetical protein
MCLVGRGKDSTGKERRRSGETLLALVQGRARPGKAKCGPLSLLLLLLLLRTCSTSAHHTEYTALRMVRQLERRIARFWEAAAGLDAV